MMRYVLTDWQKAVVGWRYWLNFGLLDINLKYRRTYLGPFWITLSFAVSAVGLSFVYSALFKVDDDVYIAYLVTGLAVWMFVSGSIIEGCSCLMKSSSLIRESNIPILSHAIRTVVAGTINFLHNAVILICAAVYAGITPNLFTLLMIPGFLLLLLNAVWMTLFFGIGTCLVVEHYTRMLILFII